MSARAPIPDAARRLVHQQDARVRPLDRAAEQELLLVAAAERAAAASRRRSTATRSAKRSPTLEPRPIQHAKACAWQSPGQEVFEHAALMKYAFAGAILGQEQHATSDAMRHRAGDGKVGRRAARGRARRDEAGERARDEVSTGADLAGDAENFPRGGSDTSCTAPADAGLSTIIAAPGQGVGRGRIHGANGRPSISSISCSRLMARTSQVATCSPLRSTVTVSQRSNTSPRRWLT